MVIYIKVKISVYNSQKDLKISARSAKKVILCLLDFYQVTSQELAIHFITNRAMCKLHAQFFNDPSPTDCISFPYDKDFLGEVFVCPATAHRYVEKMGGNLYEETTLYMAHGFLHLLGYDDIRKNERAIMKNEEKRAMHHLNQNHLLLEP